MGCARQAPYGASVCGVAQCGDGFWCFTTLECEDGNTVSGDGCSATCELDLQGAGSQTCDGSVTLGLPRVRAVLSDSVLRIASAAGDFVGGSDLGASCAPAAGPEAVYLIDVDVPSRLELSAGNAEVLSVRRAAAADCGTEELGCATGVPTATLGLNLDLPLPGRYAIILDREEPTLATTSAYTLDAELQPLP
jgi:cysteine-rich repeat protein